MNGLVASILTQRGFPITGDQSQKRFMGLKLQVLREKILVEDKFDIGEGLAEEAYSRLDEIFKNDLKSIPFIKDVIEALKRNDIPYCVASSGTHGKMHMTLGITGLLPLFEGVLFSSTQVKRGKPYPDLFLLAAETMGYRAEKCVVVEDSVPGVQAARSANMRVMAYVIDKNSPKAELEAKGGELFDDMRNLPKLFGLTE